MSLSCNSGMPPIENADWMIAKVISETFICLFLPIIVKFLLQVYGFLFV